MSQIASSLRGSSSPATWEAPTATILPPSIRNSENEILSKGPMEISWCTNCLQNFKKYRQKDNCGRDTNGHLKVEAKMWKCLFLQIQRHLSWPPKNTEWAIGGLAGNMAADRAPGEHFPKIGDCFWWFVEDKRNSPAESLEIFLGGKKEHEPFQGEHK